MEILISIKAAFEFGNIKAVIVLVIKIVRYLAFFLLRFLNFSNRGSNLEVESLY